MAKRYTRENYTRTAKRLMCYNRPMSRIKVQKLASGLRLVQVDLPGLYSTTIEIFVKMGSRWETPKEFGASHFLEHLAFKGTKKRPEAKIIFRELDENGADYNAGTTYEYTSYHIKTTPKKIKWANELLADIVLNSTFPEEEVEKERGVIKEEISMYRDNPAMGLSTDFANSFIKSKGHGCWNILGTNQSLNGLNRKALLKYRNKYLNLKNMVLVVAGDRKKIGKWRDLVSWVEEEWQYKSKSMRQLPMVEINLENKPWVKLTDKKLEQAHVCLGWNGIGLKNEKDKYVSRLAETMLMGSFSSRLVWLLREEMGVAYYVQPCGEQLWDKGYFGVQAGVVKGRLKEVQETIEKEVRGFEQRVTEEALKQAKQYMVGMTQLLMDKTNFWTDFVGQKLLLEGRVETLEQVVRKLEKVKLTEVKRFVSKYFSNAQISASIVK